MFDMPRIRPLAEDPDIDWVVHGAGGRRAHPDHHSRELRNSDYVLGQSIIELKLLEEERLDKPGARERIAEVFSVLAADRPVVVLDPRRLPEARRREYDTIMRNPIRAAVGSARGPLKQSRIEINPDATNVLLVINNGFTALSQEELVAYVVGRATNDTDQIDAVVVAGCYLHSDGMDSWALWPMECVAIREDRPFREFDDLKDSWDRLADRHMTEFVRGEHGQDAKKEAQTDIVFELDGKTYVKPAVQIGAPSDYYGERRPRRNRVTFDQVKHVARTIPRLSPVEFRRVQPALPDEPLMGTLETWQAHVERVLQLGTPDRPVVPTDISRGGWEAWRSKNPALTGLDSLATASNYRFGVAASKLVQSAREANRSEALPRRYVWVLIELIGQDERNDVSHIGMSVDGVETDIVRNLRLGHMNALALAAAHALRVGITEIRWAHDLNYAWT